MSEDTCGELSPQLSTVAIQYRMAWMPVPLIRTEVRGLRNSFLGNANVISANITEFPAESFVAAPFADSAERTGDGDDGADGATDGDDTSADKDSENGADRDVDWKDDDGEKNGKHVEIGDRDVRLALGDIVIEDLDLSGPGLPDEHIDERTYEISGFTVDINGVSAVVGETTYSIGALSVEIEPLTVTLENVTLSNA